MRFFFPRYYDQLVEVYGIAGSFGVEIFFVLSGFLIGQLIIKEVLEPPAWRGLGRFYARRWFRTLPPYYLVLGLRTFLGNPFSWKFLVFVQNFDHVLMRSFPISWSLSIEEWFYLLTPFVLLLAALEARGATPQTFFKTCAGIAVLTFAARLLCVLKWNMQPRDHIFLRMDTMMVGVMLGGLRRYSRAKYERIARHRKALFFGGLAGILGMAAWLFLEIRRGTVNDSVLMRTVFFPPLSISIGLWLLSLESSDRVNRSWANRWWAAVIRFVSVSSYSMYLIHLSAFEPFWRLNDLTRGTRPFQWMACALAVSTVLASLMYLFFERPILRLRDRLTGASAIEQVPAPAQA